jgi:hypothetical protein
MSVYEGRYPAPVVKTCQQIFTRSSGRAGMRLVQATSSGFGFAAGREQGRFATRPRDCCICATFPHRFWRLAASLLDCSEANTPAEGSPVQPFNCEPPDFSHDAAALLPSDHVAPAVARALAPDPSQGRQVVQAGPPALWAANFLLSGFAVLGALMRPASRPGPSQ